MTTHRGRRAQRFAERGHEQRELARRREASEPERLDEARDRLVQHLKDAKLAALEGRMVMVAAEIATLIQLVERRS